jgi:hypothetical protein
MHKREALHVTTVSFLLTTMQQFKLNLKPNVPMKSLQMKNQIKYCCCSTSYELKFSGLTIQGVYK